jgi:hypothetical protein
MIDYAGWRGWRLVALENDAIGFSIAGCGRPVRNHGLRRSPGSRSGRATRSLLERA